MKQEADEKWNPFIIPLTAEKRSPTTDEKLTGRDESKEQKKKSSNAKWIGILVGMLMGFVIGIVMGMISVEETDVEASFGESLFGCAWMLLLFYLAYLAQTILHEAGHLVFGLLSGYQFSSFRILRFMWVREDGKLKVKQLKIAGTGGQCLMSPPDLVDGRIPVILYNMGGVLMNLATSLVLGGLWYVFREIDWVSMAMMMLALTGILSALMNGIPMRLGVVDNDGYNAIAISKNPEAMKAFWMQMKVNDEITRGVRLREMPEEWFAVPEDEAMKNSIVAVTGVFACNRLMDERKFEVADALMEHLLKIESGIVGLHRNLMICDRLYVELMGQNRSTVIEKMRTKEFEAFVKQMKSFPTVIRTEYAYAILSLRDEKKAKIHEKEFAACAKTYPYHNEIVAEGELMEMAKAKQETEQKKSECGDRGEWS